MAIYKKLISDSYSFSLLLITSIYFSNIQFNKLTTEVHFRNHLIFVGLYKKLVMNDNNNSLILLHILILLNLVLSKAY